MDLLSIDGVDSTLIQMINFDHLPRAILILIVAIVLMRLVGRSLDTLGERITERRLLFKQIAEVGRLAITLVAGFLIAINLFDFSGEAIYGLLGLFIFLVGYSSRDLLSSVTARFVLLFDQPFQVGDRIAFGDVYGEVTEIGARAVSVVDLDDNVVSIPNSRFLTESVASSNAGALDQMCVLNFYIADGEDVERAERMVHESTASSRYVYLGKPITITVREGLVPGGYRFAIHLQLRAYVFDGRYELAFISDVHKRVIRSFRRAGVCTASERDQGATMR